MPQVVKRSELPVAVGEAFAWHERPGAFARLTPPWERVEVEQQPGGLEAGRVVLRTRLGPLRLRWVAEHVAYDPPHLFRDVQRSGPFAAWDHSHRFVDLGPDRSALIDEVTYRLPLGRPGQAVAGPFVARRLQRMFDYRHHRLRSDLLAHARTASAARLHVAITGASGLIGSALTAYLTTGGHRVTRLVRRPAAAADEVSWDPVAGTVDRAGLEGVDAVVHLAGENIGARRWTARQKRRIWRSRTEGTGVIARALAGFPDGPRVLVSASAIGYYGDRGDELLTEDSGPGKGFQPELVTAWEGAAAPARDAGVRVVHVRMGVVQTPSGGALARQLPIFRLAGAVKFGSGRQYVSWVALDDVVGIVAHALHSQDLEGPVNATAPSAVTNAEYTRTLAHVIRRPMLPIGVPPFAPGLVVGRELASELLYGSARILPQRTEASGYTFAEPQLEPALRRMLGRPAAS